jgi:hypothetical protein
MGFEVFLQCFGASEQSGISRAAVRSLFPIVEAESKPDYWRVRYDDKNSCHISVKPLPSDTQVLKSLYVERPCGDLRLWAGLLAVLRMGSVVIFWPGGPPVVADHELAAGLPQDLADAMGPAKSVSSVEQLLRLVQDS